MRSSVISLAVNNFGRALRLYELRTKELPVPASRLTSRGEETFRNQIAIIKALCDRQRIKLLWDQPVHYANSDAPDAIKAGRQVLRDELSRKRSLLLQAEAIYNFRAFSPDR